MKNLIYFSTCVVLLSTTVLSCKKDMPIITPSNIQEEAPKMHTSINVNSDGNKLIFATSDDFDRFIAADLEESNKAPKAQKLDDSKTSNRDLKTELSSENYVSYAQYIKINNLDNSVEDETLSMILNKDQIVQIGDFLYKLNKAEEKVFVLAASFSSEYSDLVSENTKNPNIQVYSTAESVIEMVENGELSQKGIFCSVRKANYKNTTTVYTTINNWANVNATSRYQKYGLMHKLEADLLVYDYDSQSDLRIYIAYDNCSYKQRCGSNLSNYSHPWRTPQGSMPITSLYTRYRVTLYSSLKRLENYTQKIRGRVEDWKNPSSTNPYTTTFTNWATISDY